VANKPANRARIAQLQNELANEFRNDRDLLTAISAAVDDVEEARAKQIALIRIALSRIKTHGLTRGLTRGAIAQAAGVSGPALHQPPYLEDS